MSNILDTFLNTLVTYQWWIAASAIIGIVAIILWPTKKKPTRTPTTATDPADDTHSDEELRVDERPVLFYSICTLFLVIMLAPWLFLGDPAEIDPGRWWIYLAAVVGLYWVFKSVRSIPIATQAAVDFYGIPLANLGSGPKFLPPGIVTLHPFTQEVLQKQEPGEPENVFKGDDSEALPEGKVRPIRILTGAPVAGASGILAIQMAIEVTFFYRYRILDPLTFLVNVNGQEQFEKQIRDTAERLLTEKVSQTPGVEALISSIATIREDLEKLIKNKVKGWGVEIIEVGIPAPDISKILAKALLKVGEDRAAAGGVRALADAARYKLEQEGAGKASAERALIEAVNASLAKADPATIAAIVGEKVLGDKAVVLGAQGLADAFGLLNLLNQQLKKGTP